MRLLVRLRSCETANAHRYPSSSATRISRQASQIAYDEASLVGSIIDFCIFPAGLRHRRILARYRHLLSARRSPLHANPRFASINAVGERSQTTDRGYLARCARHYSGSRGPGYLCGERHADTFSNVRLRLQHWREQPWRTNSFSDWSGRTCLLLRAPRLIRSEVERRRLGYDANGSWLRRHNRKRTGNTATSSLWNLFFRRRNQSTSALVRSDAG